MPGLLLTGFSVPFLFIVVHRHGWRSMFFVPPAILFVVLIYEWRNGALDFGPDGKKILKAYRKLVAKNKKS